MNDFTKDELIEIYGCVNSIICLNSQSKDYFSPLLNKIQSMIDNYDKETVMVKGEPRKLNEFIKDE